MRNEVKQLLDAQRRIFEGQVKEVFKNEPKEFVNNVLIDIMNKLPYPTEKGSQITPQELIMQPLTVEQLEYIELKKAMDLMLSEYLRLKKSGKIDVSMMCTLPDSAPRNPVYIVERLFYVYLHELQQRN